MQQFLDCQTSFSLWFRYTLLWHGYSKSSSERRSWSGQAAVTYIEDTHTCTYTSTREDVSTTREASVFGWTCQGWLHTSLSSTYRQKPIFSKLREITSRLRPTLKSRRMNIMLCTSLATIPLRYSKLLKFS